MDLDTELIVCNPLRTSVIRIYNPFSILASLNTCSLSNTAQSTFLMMFIYFVIIYFLLLLLDVGKEFSQSLHKTLQLGELRKHRALLKPCQVISQSHTRAVMFPLKP